MEFVFVILLPALLSIGFGWWALRQSSDKGHRPRWSFTLASFALVAASVGFILDFVFLAHGWTSRRLSYPPVGVWMLIGVASGLIFRVALAAAVLGKGWVRLPLAIDSIARIGANFWS